MTIKVLELCGKLNIGGAQLVAANIGLHAPDGYEITYLVYGDEVGEYEQEILARGHRIIHMAPPRGNAKSYIRELTDLIRRGGYDAVHCHTMFSSGVVMLAAKRAGVRGRICHSHTAKDNTKLSVSRRAYRWFMRLLIHTCATDYLACGVEAGRALYGKRWFDRCGRVIKNGIDVRAFSYREEAAGQIREKYGLEGKFVLGHVGHYVDVKNQSFLIRLMPELLKRRPNAVLLMFGDGEDRKKLSALIEKYHLKDSAFLMGNVRNIDKILSAFDVFVFPSHFEGTPLALLEAQANGLPCLISDRIPEDACLTPLITRLPLDAPEQWIEKIISASRDDNTDWAAEIESRYETVEQSMNELYQIFQSYADNCKE